MARICEWVARFAEIVQGMDALAHQAVWDRLFALTSPRPGLIENWAIEGRDGQMRPVPRAERAAVMAAIAGIDIALGDLKGKAAGMPEWRLLGSAGPPPRTSQTGGVYPPARPPLGSAQRSA